MTKSVRKARHAAAKFCGAFLFAVFIAAPVSAQDYGEVPYVQTPQHVVDKMLEVAGVGPKDYVIDLGSGDGRMIITAAKKFGARGFGVDLDTNLVKRANALAAKAGVADRARFYARDLYKTDFRPATVITVYLLPEVNLMVRPKLLATLRPGTRVVSHDYDMGEWEPDQSFVLDVPDKPVGRDKKSSVFYWVVPAKASGKWRWQLPAEGRPQVFELALNQKFQHIEGTLTIDGRRAGITDAKLSGTKVSFSATLENNGAPLRYRFSGRIAGDSIKGRARIMHGQAEKRHAWKAKRIEHWEPAHASLPPPTPPGF